MNWHNNKSTSSLRPISFGGFKLYCPGTTLFNVCDVHAPIWTRFCALYKHFNYYYYYYNVQPKTPSIGLYHFSNHCHNWLHHRSLKTVSSRTVFCWCSNGSKFVTDCCRRPKLFESRWNSSYTEGASCLYALMLLLSQSC